MTREIALMAVSKDALGRKDKFKGKDGFTIEKY